MELLGCLVPRALGNTLHPGVHGPERGGELV